jgi:protein-tyrosine-phosphatase
MCRFSSQILIKMMTPKEYSENLINQFDMIIYTDQDHDTQVLKCSKKAIELKILTIERMWDNAPDGDALTTLISNELSYFNEVLNCLKCRL